LVSARTVWNELEPDVSVQLRPGSKVRRTSLDELFRQ